MAEVGDLLNGRYRLEREIGQGGFARVFLGRDTTPLNRPVAIKVLRPDRATAPAFLALFANEANRLANLDHPHILTAHDYGTDGESAYLVMPYIPGGTLADLLRRRGALPLSEVAVYLGQVASALDYAHARGVVHRDVKPHNLFLREDGSLVLADFGIAKVVQETQGTSSSSVMGTIAYMAPEQFDGRASRASDVYSLGCVLFELLTGRTPFTGTTQQIMRGHMMGEIPRLAEHVRHPVSPPALQRAVEWALAKDPAARCPSAGALAAAVRDVAAGQAPTQLAAQPGATAAGAATVVPAQPLVPTTLPTTLADPRPPSMSPAPTLGDAQPPSTTSTPTLAGASPPSTTATATSSVSTTALPTLPPALPGGNTPPPTHIAPTIVAPVPAATAPQPRRRSRGPLIAAGLAVLLLLAAVLGARALRGDGQAAATAPASAAGNVSAPPTAPPATATVVAAAASGGAPSPSPTAAATSTATATTRPSGPASSAPASTSSGAASSSSSGASPGGSAGTSPSGSAGPSGDTIDAAIPIGNGGKEGGTLGGGKTKRFYQVKLQKNDLLTVNLEGSAIQADIIRPTGQRLPATICPGSRTTPTCEAKFGAASEGFYVVQLSTTAAGAFTLQTKVESATSNPAVGSGQVVSVVDVETAPEELQKIGTLNPGASFTYSLTGSVTATLTRTLSSTPSGTPVSSQEICSNEAGHSTPSCSTSKIYDVKMAGIYAIKVTTKSPGARYVLSLSVKSATQPPHVARQALPRRELATGPATPALRRRPMARPEA